MLPSKTWIGVWAHPDDEWIAGWPVFQDLTCLHGVIFFVGNNSPGKTKEKEEWLKPLRNLLQSMGIRYLGCLNLRPNFYHGDRRERTRWKKMLNVLLDSVFAKGPFADTAIITHNPVGEYGHPDHIEVFRAVMAQPFDRDVYITDIGTGSRISPLMSRTFYSKKITASLNLKQKRWVKAREAYHRFYRWTGRDGEPVNKKASLYKL